MGAWGFGSFDNDTAGDWVCGLEGKSDLLYIEETLDTVLSVGEGYLEAPDAEAVIAAAEAIARLQGHIGIRNAYTETMDNWVSKVNLKPTSEIASKAKQALARIQREPSELLELWSESPEADNWKQSLLELASRIH